MNPLKPLLYTQGGMPWILEDRTLFPSLCTQRLRANCSYGSQAEAAEASGCAGGEEEVWKAKFVRAMNNLTAVDLRHGKQGGARGPGSHASQVSVAESAAEKALGRLQVRAPASRELVGVSGLAYDGFRRSGDSPLGVWARDGSAEDAWPQGCSSMDHPDC